MGNGKESPSFYGRSKYLRAGKPVKKRAMTRGNRLRMGKQVETYFARLYGIGELISTRRVLTAAEERERMKARALEKLARKCAGLLKESEGADSGETSGESELE